MNGVQGRMGEGWGRNGAQGMDGARTSPAGPWCPRPWQCEGGTRGHRRWQGAGRRCQAPRSTHRKAGGARGTGVAGLPWRSLCGEDGAEPPVTPQVGTQSPQGVPCPPHPPPTTTPGCSHSPAPLWLRPARLGRVPPGDPWRGEERSWGGGSHGPCPVLYPQGAWAESPPGAATCPQSCPGTAAHTWGTHLQPVSPTLCRDPRAAPGAAESPAGGAAHGCPPASTRRCPGHLQTTAGAPAAPRPPGAHKTRVTQVT